LARLKKEKMALEYIGTNEFLCFKLQLPDVSNNQYVCATSDFEEKRDAHHLAVGSTWMAASGASNLRI